MRSLKLRCTLEVPVPKRLGPNGPIMFRSTSKYYSCIEVLAVNLALKSNQVPVLNLAYFFQGRSTRCTIYLFIGRYLPVARGTGTLALVSGGALQTTRNC